MLCFILVLVLVLVLFMIMFNSLIVKVSGWLTGVALVFSFLDYYSIFRSFHLIFIFEVVLSVSFSLFLISFSFIIGRVASNFDEGISRSGKKIPAFIFILFLLFLGIWVLWEHFLYDGRRLLSFFVGVELVVVSVFIFYFWLCSFFKIGEK